MNDVALALGRSRRLPPVGPPALLAPSADPAAVVVTGLLLDAFDRPPSRLSIMDLGAGDGRCGQILARHGVATLVAVDREAGLTPIAYTDHIVGELTTLDAHQQARLDRHRFDGLVSAIGLGHAGLAPSEFLEAIDHVTCGGWICVALDAGVLGARDRSGFGALVRALSVRGVLEIETLTDFGRRVAGVHREQVALLARKGRAIYDA